jgi:hypothetical protein
MDDDYALTLWPSLFNAATTSSNLTSFRCSEHLEEQLLGLLLDHATALKELGVSQVNLSSNTQLSGDSAYQSKRRHATENHGPAGESLCVQTKRM